MTGLPWRVLVIDDVEDQRDLLAHLFTRAGCVVQVAAGTEEAQELLRAATPDIAVIDLLLGGDDNGWTAIDATRELAPSAKIIVTSVLDVAEFPEADARLPKPFTIAQVQALVDGFRPAS
ncbi:response regulator [uncultured Microbacterium sp.]|uniref:Response regulatory domain-containing protein n=1 Tax=uncultured Microbacterium sp. TaxID=191216 RepID=A0A1Y5P8Z1_9MICO|nr:response regulator [uncultured Microbacterium sp.]SBS72581.1 hypothetical protein MIPYR_30094 [uncultured Microbacterium sp.]